MKFRIAILLILLSLLPWTGAAGEDPARARIAAQIRLAISRLHSQRSAQRRQLQELQQAQKLLDSQLDRLARQLDRAKVRDQDQRAALASLETELEQQRQDSGKARDFLLGLCQSATVTAKRMKARIAKGIPAHRPARLARAEIALRELGAGAFPRRSAGLAELCTLAGDELRLARSISLESAPVRLGPSLQINAYRLRLGLVSELFLSEDGRRLGLSSPAGWITELSPARQALLRRTIDAVQGRRAPEIAPVPLLLAKERP